MVRTTRQLFSKSPYIRRVSCLNADQLRNIDKYLDTLLQNDSSHLRKTHLFHGRYENIYVDQPDQPDLLQLLEETKGICAQLLEIDANELALGFWFNLMLPGQITDWHTHDDLDELISGVVYLTVPEHSGDFIFRQQDNEIRVTPRQGHFLFFDPAMPHAVSENCSPHHRLSIGINIGRKDDS